MAPGIRALSSVRRAWMRSWSCWRGFQRAFREQRQGASDPQAVRECLATEAGSMASCWLLISPRVMSWHCHGTFFVLTSCRCHVSWFLVCCAMLPLSVDSSLMRRVTFLLLLTVRTPQGLSFSRWRDSEA